jgi:hypothetical protein
VLLIVVLPVIGTSDVGKPDFATIARRANRVTSEMKPRLAGVSDAGVAHRRRPTVLPTSKAGNLKALAVTQGPLAAVTGVTDDEGVRRARVRPRRVAGLRGAGEHAGGASSSAITRLNEQVR